MTPINSLIPKSILLCFMAVLIVSCNPSSDDATVPIIIVVPVSTSDTSVPTDVPTTVTGSDPVSSPEPAPLVINHEIRYDCDNSGGVTRAEVIVYPSGGIPPYTVKPNGAYKATPGENLTIEVFSGTADGKPSNSVNIKIERKVAISECHTVTTSSTGKDPSNQNGSITDEPATDEPATDEPATVEPATEEPISTNTCKDGKDNDGDNKVDGADKGCKNKHDTVED